MEDRGRTEMKDVEATRLQVSKAAHMTLMVLLVLYFVGTSNPDLLAFGYLFAGPLVFLLGGLAEVSEAANIPKGAAKVCGAWILGLCSMSVLLVVALGLPMHCLDEDGC